MAHAHVETRSIISATSPVLCVGSSLVFDGFSLVLRPGALTEFFAVLDGPYATFAGI